MAQISSQQPGISSTELAEALPESLLEKSVHLYWIDHSRPDTERYTLTAKLDIDGQTLLLSCVSRDLSLLEQWAVDDPGYHTNARLVALERILTDPENEERLMSI
ncbi:MAG: hypothetical protein R2751_08715 [Bacteroidales bacterium]